MIILIINLIMFGHDIEIVREMPNMDICKNAMIQLENVAYSLECRQQDFE